METTMTRAPVSTTATGAALILAAAALITPAAAQDLGGGNITGGGHMGAGMPFGGGGNGARSHSVVGFGGGIPACYDKIQKVRTSRGVQVRNLRICD
jgi:hypothetical protein